jgi:1-deoxy-D-xylulose-5-phosphate synthase
VGHQCYAHKLLTGRATEFSTIRLRDGLSGFPKRSESVHDAFDTGHSSTAISAALGILVAREHHGESSHVIAVVGDGALSGGMAFEALNHAGHLARNLIIVLNDNQMSIGPNVGALSSYLSRVTATRLYQTLRRRIDTSVERIPVFGARLLDLIVRGKRSIKAFFFRERLFSDLGFEYVGPIDGHNIALMVDVFEQIRKLEKPIVVHLSTQKGRGYHQAELDPALYHGVSPFSVLDGKLEETGAVTYTDVFSRAVVEAAEREESIVAITAAMAKGTGLGAFRHRFPDRFFDVGICEQHALTFAAGLASEGLRPVVAIYSTFLQRGIDQLIHDIALPGFPVVCVADRAGVVPGDGETHQGIYDIALCRSLPGLTLLAPGSREDLSRMIEWSFSHDGPVVIRIAKSEAPAIRALDVAFEPGRGVFLRRSREETLVIAVGSMCAEVLASQSLLAERGITIDIYALRCVKPLQVVPLGEILFAYRRVYVVEEGVLPGGAGEAIVAAARSVGIDVPIETIGISGMFNARGSRDELLCGCRLDAVGIAERITEALGVEHL